MDFLSQLTVEDMPNQEMRWVAEDCGLDVAVMLIKHLRGLKVYVPSIKDTIPKNLEQMPNEDMRVVAEYCGMEVATKLLETMGGCFVSIPRHGPWCKRFILEHCKTKTVSRIAIHLGVTSNYVYNVIQSSASKKIGNKKRRVQTANAG